LVGGLGLGVVGGGMWGLGGFGELVFMGSFCFWWLLVGCGVGFLGLVLYCLFVGVVGVWVFAGCGAVIWLGGVGGGVGFELLVGEW